MATLVTSVLGLLSSVRGGRNISAGVVTALRTEELWNRGSIPTRAKIFFLSKSVQTGFGPPISCSFGAKAYSLGGKPLGA